MGDDNQPDQKKRFPGGFLLLLLMSLLVILLVQSLSGEKGAKVSFSHQLEHLMNLDLVQKDENRKVALNDNLVTFSGKFKEELSDGAKARYRYLELLNENHQIVSEQRRLEGELGDLEKNVSDAASLFLQLSGMTIPKTGYVVVDSSYDTPQRRSEVVIQSLSDRQVVSYADLLAMISRVSSQPTEGGVDQLGKQFTALLQAFRSPALGIGSEPIKGRLSSLSERAEQNLRSGASLQDKVIILRGQLDELNQIIQVLNTEENGVRLASLRAVRSYMEDLAVYTGSYADLEKNQAQLDKARTTVANVIWFFNNKEVSTRTLEQQDPEEFTHWYAGAKREWENFAYNRGLPFKAPDQPRNLVLERTFKSEEPAPNYFSYLVTLLPVLLIVVFLYFVFSKQMKGVGNSAMNFGKSPARMLNKAAHKTTFKEVAGVDEAKEELSEIVDFLKDPTRFTALGARIPRGVLLVGPPGTGKTLVAKAVAGEADRPFFSISGSDFVEMFVGVGASRIRDLFDQAKKQAPCIIFIDEIDAVGRHRGAGFGGGHDEREQTLNQLLVEMDGFDTNEGVILMAATNRPDVLDKALLRPGRFDRRVILDLPDIKGRFEILKVHARRVKLDSSVDLMSIAKGTAGCSGADLMNILNESALLAARKGRTAVTNEDALEACDKVRYGKERRSLEIDSNEKKNTAYHESGHAVIGLVVKHSDPVDKVTIIPRGMSLGATHFLPDKNRVTYWRRELLDKLAVLMGGRVAEELFLGDISTGAQMDINQATQLARSMVCKWGMTDSLGKVAYDDKSDEPSYMSGGGQASSYSDETAKEIDLEVRRILDEAYQRATDIINQHRDKLELMTNMLIEFETLDKEDVRDIVDGKWDSEKKKGKLLLAQNAHRKTPPPIPPLDSAHIEPNPAM